MSASSGAAFSLQNSLTPAPRFANVRQLIPMTHWQIVNADILDLAADGLICSANPSLNLYGGFGGAFALRFGNAMQEHLHHYLRQNNLRFVPAGNAVVAPSCGSRYAAIAHAVSIDAFYVTNATLIFKTYCNALGQLGKKGCRNIVAACLGCGYGRCSPSEFRKVIQNLIAQPFDAIENVTLVTTNAEQAELIADILNTANADEQCDARKSPVGRKFES